MFQNRDTIAAQATAAGEGGVAIVRVSGADCEAIVSRVFQAKNGKPLANRVLTYGCVMENGEMFVEEYTLVAVADYVLSNTPGPAVSNLSSSRALRDVALDHNCPYQASAVGEVNVTTLMKKINAVIGGEGNGGVIYPELHYGRDALVGVALFLTLLAKSGMKVSELKKTYPQYEIAKTKLQLTPDMDVDAILAAVEKHYANEKLTTIDGVKIDFKDGWAHLRKSNTEPIIRIYSEAHTMEEAEKLGNDVKKIVESLI